MTENWKRIVYCNDLNNVYDAGGGKGGGMC